MEVRLAKIEKDIKTIYKNIKRQDEETVNLTKIASSIVELTAEIKYMRKDVNKNRDQIDCIQETLTEKERTDRDKRIEKYEDVERQIKSWLIKGLLALLALGFITAMGIKLNGGV